MWDTLCFKMSKVGLINSGFRWKSPMFMIPLNICNFRTKQLNFIQPSFCSMVLKFSLKHKLQMNSKFQNTPFHRNLSWQRIWNFQSICRLLLSSIRGLIIFKSFNWNGRITISKSILQHLSEKRFYCLMKILKTLNFHNTTRLKSLEKFKVP